MATPLRLVFDPTGDLLQSARECEADIFLQWYGNTRAQLEEEYSPYEQSSVFVALADDEDQVVGTVRFLVHGGSGLKTLDDAAKPPWEVDSIRSATAARIDTASTWDCATMGVRPGVTGSRVQLGLAVYHGLLLALRANEVRTVIAVLDERVRRLLSSVGLVMNALPGTGPAPYLGSTASTPVYAHVGQALDHQRRVHPDAHRLVTLGIGLDGISTPGTDAFRWTPKRLEVVTASSATQQQLASASVGHLR